jgi:hypothetical protein
VQAYERPIWPRQKAFTEQGFSVIHLAFKLEVSILHAMAINSLASTPFQLVTDQIASILGMFQPQHRLPASCPDLHLMHLAVLSPPPEHLPLVPEQHAKETPQYRERHIRHDGFDVPRPNNPRGDEPAKAITPHVFVDGDGHEDRSGDGFVRVNGVG